jgi:hypothetical protein
VLVVLHGLHQFSLPENERAEKEKWEWDCKRVAQDLRAGLGAKDPLMAVTAIGCFSYWSGFPMVDMLGLTDETLPRMKPDDFGSGWIGHELGSGSYVLGRQPDIIVFCRPRGDAVPCFRAGKEMVRDPVFHERYRLVTLYAGCPDCYRSQLYLNIESPRIGIVKGQDEIHVPGYFIAGNPDSFFMLSKEGILGTYADKRTPAVFSMTLPEGTWTFMARHSGAVPDMSIAYRGRSVTKGSGPQSIELDTKTDVTVRMTPHEDGPLLMLVHGLSIRRL